ncbi:MAG: M48 family metallopeptidase [Rhodospirillales bacterium]|nr:M48 family metallopeptidase [Rhodospirillales bacterium]
MLKHIFDIATFLVITCVVIVGTVPAHAKETGLIRDQEIENTIRLFAAPVFKVANLDPSAVKIHLVLDNTLNAFVAGGQRLFINTGLITNAKSASQIIGVIAHETGHIAGGHLARFNKVLENSTAVAILSAVLGAGAIVAGQGQVGGLIIAAGQGVAQQNFLRYSQTQESAADQAALKYLDQTGQSANGLLGFMNLLGEQELLVPEYQDAYARTHPLTRDRVSAITSHVAKSQYSKIPVSPQLDALFRRARAKLVGYVNPIGATLRIYKSSDSSLESRYARAIGYYRKAEMAKALPLIDSLLAEYPNDPFFWELKGQMIFENGDAKGALSPYKTASRLLPDSALIKRDLARVQLALDDPSLLPDIIANLLEAIAEDKESPFTWRQLAIAYGRMGDKGHSSLALAEEALLIGRPDVAKYHGGLAERVFPMGSREWLQAQDIIGAARPNKK